MIDKMRDDCSFLGALIQLPVQSCSFVVQMLFCLENKIAETFFQNFFAYNLPIMLLSIGAFESSSDISL